MLPKYYGKRFSSFVKSIKRVEIKDANSSMKNVVALLSKNDIENPPTWLKDSLNAGAKEDLKKTKGAYVYGDDFERCFAVQVDPEKLTGKADRINKLATGAITSAEKKQIEELSVWFSSEIEDQLKADLANQMIMSSYKWVHKGDVKKDVTESDDSEEDQKPKFEHVKSLDLVADFQSQNAVDLAVIKANAANYTRSVGNSRGSVATPEFMENEALKLQEKYPSLKVTSIKGEEVRKAGMNLLYNVGQSAVSAPRLVAIEYNGAADQKWQTIVGKGVTFDTGGLNTKPGVSMNEMFLDKMGAANVLGIMQAVAELKLPINVVGVMTLAESAVDAHSYKPMEILTSLKGLTVEIHHTDAEGRLCLADAMTWAQREYDTEVMIDMATLTGACVVALGENTSAVFYNDEVLADELVNASSKALEQTWKMPIMPDHREAVKGKVADIVNSTGKAWGGACTAAAFLENFVEKGIKWAHIDIAGPALFGKKATGHGVSIVVEYLRSRSQQN